MQKRFLAISRLVLFSAWPGLLFPAAAQADHKNPICFLQRIPVAIDGNIYRLEMRIYKPAADDKLPTLILNHGSTGSGINSDRFKQPVDMPAIASFFVKRNWAVVIPARRGRAGSDGMYDEGFSVIRMLGYTCFSSRSLAGAERALRDIEAAMEAIIDMPFVDKKRIAIGGVSRGGALSIAYAGMHPTQVVAVINFVGGWLGWPCPTMSAVNQSLFNRGATYPGKTIWLYAENDAYYSISHSRKNFEAFLEAGGKGVFCQYKIPSKNGHCLPRFTEVWTRDLDMYLKSIAALYHD